MKAIGLLLLLGIIYLLRPLVVVRFVGGIEPVHLENLPEDQERHLCGEDVRLIMGKRVFDIWTAREPAEGYLRERYERCIFTSTGPIPKLLCEGAKFLDWWWQHELTDTVTH